MSKKNRINRFPHDPRRWNNADQGRAAENVLLDLTCEECVKADKCPFAFNEWGSCEHHIRKWQMTADMASAVLKATMAIRSAGGAPDWIRVGEEAFEAIKRVMNETKKK